MNCADNPGAKNLYVISVKGIHASLNRLLAAGVGDMDGPCCKNDVLRKSKKDPHFKRQRKPWRKRDGVFLYFEGSAITGSVKECADLWPRIASSSGTVVRF
ncbi:2303_t:CDS:2, partial [Entrophospora sp. SA101]